MLRTAGGDGPCLLATDGGARQRPPTLAFSAWGIAVALRDGESAWADGGVVRGLDHSPYIAKDWAMLHCILLSYALAPRRIMILVDNQAVVDLFQRVCEPDDPLPMQARALWENIRDTAREQEEGVGRSTVHCRRLNDKADDHCTCAMAEELRKREPMMCAYAEATRWSKTALQVLIAGVTAHAAYQRGD